MALKDSTFSSAMAASIAETQIKYETEKKQLALDQATLENQLKESFINKIETRNTILAVLLILSFLLATGTFYLYKKNKKSRAHVLKQNTELQLLIDQKSLLLKEIHHRVKNNLQTVSSLLSLQTRATNDETVKKAIGVGQSRLKSISLLHQKLYQRDELQKIEMEGYIDDLSTYILKSANYHDKNIQLKIKTTDIALDLDTAIPIGLIINELITNAIKHSFDEVEHCFIHIEMERNPEKGTYKLEIITNGKSIPKNLDIDKLQSTGLRLVKNLSRQLQGKFTSYEYDTAHFIVHFKEDIV